MKVAKDDLFLSALEIVNLKISDLRERLEIYSVGDDYFAKSNISQFINYKDLGFVDRKYITFYL